jgi:hypothetical protein
MIFVTSVVSKSSHEMFINSDFVRMVDKMY